MRAPTLWRVSLSLVVHISRLSCRPYPQQLCNNAQTATQQIVAADPSQLRSFLTPLLRAAELRRSAGASGLVETKAAMIDKGFAKYILGELRWELEQFNMSLPGAEPIQPEQIEVLSYSGNVLRFKVKGVTFDAHLSWRGAVPPVINRVTHAAP